MASSSTSKSSTKEPASQKFLVLFLGLLIGFVIGFVMLLSRLPVDDSLGNFQARETSREPAGQADGFRFYDLLPKQAEPRNSRRAESSQAVVKIVEREPAAIAKPTISSTRVIPPATRTVPPNAQNLSDGYRVVEASFQGDNQSYFLQAGKFKSHQEAQSMRAKVLMLGLQAFVIEREEPDGRTRHRVRVGPYTELGLLTEAKKRLKRGGIRYEIVRVTS